MNQMIGLEEIFVLPSVKLFEGSPMLKENFLLTKWINVNMNYKEANRQNEIKDYWNYHVHPPSVLPRLFSGKQKSWTTFLKGREEDEIMSRTSTLTDSSKHPFKVKAILNFRLFRFLPIRLLLDLYD